MPKNRLTEEQMDAIDRLLCEPTSHAISYVPHRVMAESFLDLDAYLEEHYLPRFIDRYALVVLVLLYTWADHVRIAPGKGGRNEYHTLRRLLKTTAPTPATSRTSTISSAARCSTRGRTRQTFTSKAAAF